MLGLGVVRSPQYNTQCVLEGWGNCDLGPLCGRNARWRAPFFVAQGTPHTPILAA